MTINKVLKEEMPREKLIKIGAKNLCNFELLAIILRVGCSKQNVLELSRSIFKKFNLNQISHKGVNELCEFSGISTVKATQIIATFEIAKRFEKSIKSNIKNRFGSSDEIYDFVKQDFLALPIEKVMLVLVNAKNYLIHKEFISEGDVSHSHVNIRQIIKLVLNYNATGFFLIHNHPSGDPTPSADDIYITKQIKKASDELNLRFLDHIIIGDDYYSLFDNQKF